MTPLPLVVSFYTVDATYEPLAARLRASCERHGLHHRIVPIEPRGSWAANNAAKASIVQEAWRLYGEPILWVDADAVFHAVPELLRGAKEDFGVHRWRGRNFAGGTLFFNQTPLARTLLNGWVTRCQNQKLLDQIHLEREWRALVLAQPSLRTIWLPRSYCQIFDAQWENNQAPVIEHFQASRTQKVQPEAVL